LQLSRGVAEILPLLLASQLLEAPCGFLDFLGQLPLRITVTAASIRVR